MDSKKGICYIFLKVINGCFWKWKTMNHSKRLLDIDFRKFAWFHFQNNYQIDVGVFEELDSKNSNKAFCECKRFSACSQTTLWLPSITSALTSSPR